MSTSGPANHHLPLEMSVLKLEKVAESALILEKDFSEKITDL
jgi:hypothetical protein